MAQRLKSYHFAWLRKHPDRSEMWLRDRLRDGFHVHHVDEDHGNDRPDNLILMDGNDHLLFHGIPRPCAFNSDRARALRLRHLARIDDKELRRVALKGWKTRRKMKRANKAYAALPDDPV